MTAAGTRRPVVLVADDDDDIRALVLFRLQRAGYEVIAATDGEEALRLARERLPDLAVLDVAMPKLRGDEVTRCIRADEVTGEMAVILLTAQVKNDEVAEGFDAGADDYIDKPFRAEELRARVRTVLREAERRSLAGIRRTATTAGYAGGVYR